MWGEEAKKTLSLSSLRRKKERWLLNVIYALWFSYSKYGHMLLHAEPPTCVSLQDGTHTGAGGDTEAPSILRMEKIQSSCSHSEGSNVGIPQAPSLG